MTDLAVERQKSAKLAMRYLRNIENVKSLRKGGYSPTTPIIVCEYSTPTSEVRSMLRLQDASPRVLILMRKGEDVICALGATTPEASGEHFIPFADVAPEAEIGMVYDAIEAQLRFGHVKLGSDQSAHHVGNYQLELA